MSSIDTSDNRNEGLHTDRESGPGGHPPTSGRAERHSRDCYPPRYQPIPRPARSPFSLLLYRPHHIHPHGTRFDCEALSVPTDLLYQLVTISCRLFPFLVFRFFPPFFFTKFSIGCSGLIATFAVDNRNRAEWNDSAGRRDTFRVALLLRWSGRDFRLNFKIYNLDFSRPLLDGIKLVFTSFVQVIVL